MGEVIGTRLRGVSDARVRSGVIDLLDRLAPPLEDRVVIVPDVHYPFHTSTGLITNPAAVEGAIEWARTTGRTVELAAWTAGWKGVDACLEYTGYTQMMERLGVERFEPSGEEHLAYTVRIDGDDTVITTPAAFITDALVFPTLRCDRTNTLQGALHTLAGAVVNRLPTAQEVLCVGELSGASAVLDASYAYPGHPYRSELLLASSHVVAIDRFIGEQPGWSAPVARSLHRPPPPVRGIDSAAISAAFPRPTHTAQPPTGDVLATGYRAYTKLTGDLVPPQVIDP